MHFVGRTKSIIIVCFVVEIDDNDGDVTILVPNISTESYRCPICHKVNDHLLYFMSNLMV